MRIKIVNDIFLRTSEVVRAKLDIWFIHGFGGSGQIFQEAFGSPLIKEYNLFAPDLPGCGVTPSISTGMDLSETTNLLALLIEKISINRPIVIIAHSLGGIIGTRLCERLKSQVKTYINVEGNLTESDAYFCGLANEFDSAVEFYGIYLKKVFSMLDEGGEALHRHYASMQFAHPQTLYILGKSGAAATGEKKSGEEFIQLSCKKIYYWSDTSIPQQTKELIYKMNLPNRCFTGCGHWPMIDKPNEFYDAVRSELQL